jgi:predicted  nucleic acid-binding Zn-ribbon protein
MSQVAEIRTLQELDDAAETHRAAFDEVERRLSSNEPLDEARRTFAAADSELAALRREQKRLDAQGQSLTARIVPEEKRLYDGSVKNPKELSSIQHEVELLKEQRRRIEDELLELLGRLEVAEREHGVALEAVTRLEAEWEKEQRDLKLEATRLQDSIARADARREAQRTRLTPRALQVYEGVRKRRGGMAVARIQGGACGGCRVSLPDAVRKLAFSAEQIPQCPNCERILYFG